MKRLSDYIAESAFARENPTAGDALELIFNEELCVSTQVYESSPDHLIFDADQTLISLLEHCGCALEEDEGDDEVDESLSPMVPSDSASPIPGGHHEKLDDLDPDNDSPVANAIIRRIVFRHPDVLSTHGPERVVRAAQEVADWVGEVDEIGSSDVSAWTRDAIRALAELPDEPMHVGDRLDEAKYQGREVKLGKPMAGDVKKYKVYVRDPKTGNIKKVNFGDKKLSIKRDDPKRRKNFRARHNCAQAKDRTSAKYWSCRFWSRKPVSQLLKGK